MQLRARPKKIYLDYNATTPLDPAVQNDFVKGLRQIGNPSSQHEAGRAAKELLESTRETVADYLGVTSATVLFTSGATEANNTVLRSIAYRGIAEKKPPHIVTTAIEHPSILETCGNLAQLGLETTRVGCDTNGVVNAAEIKRAIRPNTRLIAMMAANNETGALQPVDAVLSAAGEAKIPVLVDAVQAIGKNVGKTWTAADFVSLSAHKFYGPKGLGILLVKSDDSITPLLTGGTQEHKLRAGTPNVPAISALKTAITLLKQHEYTDYRNNIRLRHRLLTGLKTISGFQLNSPENDQCLAQTLNISFGDISGETIMMNLDLAGVAVSTGSACSTGSVEPSHVLLAMGRATHEALTSVRLSWGRFTTESDIDSCLDALKHIVTRLSKNDD